MELHQFIKESVREIIKGMIEARTDTHKFTINNDNGNGIEFDVAISAGSSAEGKAGVSYLKVIEAGVKSNISELSTHRLKFTIIPKGKRQKNY
ncbi:MAG: trypco2 family protein [Candidatus Buchananbacteria bacterium]